MFTLHMYLVFFMMFKNKKTIIYPSKHKTYFHPLLLPLTLPTTAHTECQLNYHHKIQQLSGIAKHPLKEKKKVHKPNGILNSRY